MGFRSHRSREARLARAPRPHPVGGRRRRASLLCATLVVAQLALPATGLADTLYNDGSTSLGAIQSPDPVLASSPLTPVADPDASARRACETGADRVRAAFGADPAAHLRWTAEVLRFLTHQPLAVLDGCQQALEERIVLDGPEPYWSLVIELADRLASSPSGETRARFERLGAAVGGTLAPTTYAPEEPGVLLRAMDGSGFRAYSQNAGFVVGALAITGFGDEMFVLGAAGEHLLRSAELYRQCDANRERA